MKEYNNLCVTDQPSQPRRPDYRPRRQTMADLPFVQDQDGERRFWVVESSGDYHLDNIKGAEYAAHYLEFLKVYPFQIGAGMTGWILKEMDWTGKGKGIAIGFISFFERFLHSGVINGDPWSVFQQELIHWRELQEEQSAGEDAA